MGNLGTVDSVWFAHSKDERIRYMASSGGFVKSFLVYLLEKRKVDYAILTRTGGTDSPLQPETIITDRNEDILTPRTNSVYMAHNALSVLKDVQAGKRYAFVGLPCQTRAVAHMLTISLVCNYAPDRDFTLGILDKLDVVEEDVSRIEYRGNGWPGGFTAHLKDGSSRFIRLPDYWNRLSIPQRCKHCTATGQLADFVVGDPWRLGLEKGEHKGLSLVICRNSKATKLVKDARSYITIKPCSMAELVKSQGKHFESKGGGYDTSTLDSTGERTHNPRRGQAALQNRY